MGQEKYLSPEEVLSQPFSVDLFKRCPHLEFEVMINPEGEIFYALPSHQEYLIAAVMRKNHWTRDQVMEACPPEYHFDFMRWLIKMAGGIIPVWNIGIMDYPLTQKQKAALRNLKMAGLYRGTIPK